MSLIDVGQGMKEGEVLLWNEVVGRAVSSLEERDIHPRSGGGLLGHLTQSCLGSLEI